MQKKYYPQYSKISKIIDSAENLANLSDLFRTRCILSDYINNLSKRQGAIIIRKNNFYIEIFDKIFANDKFNEYLLKILCEEEALLSKEHFRDQARDERDKIIKNCCFEEKRFIYASICLSGILLALCLDELSDKNIVYLREKFRNSIKKIQKYQEGKYTLTNICFKLYDISYQFTYDFHEEFPLRLDAVILFRDTNVSRYLVGTMLLMISQINCLESAFKNINKQRESPEKFSVPGSLTKLFRIAGKIGGGMNYFVRMYKKEYNDQYFENFLIRFGSINERSLLFILKEMTACMHVQEGKTFSDVILEKIKNAKKIKDDLTKFAKANYEAYSSILAGDKVEWSNKIFLISVKTLSVLESIGDAKDDAWKINVAVFELQKWIHEVHQVLNKFDIEDDWEIISKFIVQETDLVEWKSSFLTSLQHPPLKEKEILKKIIKPMLGMMNTEGGTIIVGLVEKIDKVTNPEVAENIIEKNGKYFFDIRLEFDKYGTDMDEIKRRIQDLLCNETCLSIDKINGLWDIRSVILKNNVTDAEIYMISIKKSQNKIFCAKVDGGNLWVSLLRRVDGRTIFIDPRG